jgi:transposase
MVTSVIVGKKSAKRRPAFAQAVLGKPTGVIQERVKSVGPERFGIVSVDCAKDRSKWMLVDFYGRVLVPPTTVEHRRNEIQLALLTLKQAIDRYGIRDTIVAVEMTGTYHQIIWRAFRTAGYDTRTVHPFASSHYRAPEHGDIKTDDHDLIAIFRAAVNGFGLIEQPWDDVYRSLQLFVRHRRDLVKKRAKLQCQIRQYLDRCLPGYTNLFQDHTLWTLPVGLKVLQFIAQHGGTHQTLLDAGIPGVSKWLKEQKVVFQSRSVGRIVAWAANAVVGDPMRSTMIRIWESLLQDWQQKTQQIIAVEQEIAGLLVQTPWVLMMSHPGINVVSAAELAGETGPIEHYACAKSITGRAGLFPSRYQSDGVDRGGNLSRFRNARLRAAWLQVAECLLKCNDYWQGKFNHWKSQGHDARDIRVRIANRMTRTAFQMVAGRKIFSHRSRLERSYILDKLLTFHRDHDTPLVRIMTDLKAAADQMPKYAYADEARPLTEVRRRSMRSRRAEPQQLGNLLIGVLVRLGVTIQTPTLNSPMLEAPAADSDKGDR